MSKNKFYSIQAKQQDGQKVAELRIYDEIGFWGMTAADFVAQLDSVTENAEKIVVSINSPGGNVFDAFAIYNALLRHKLPVQTRVDGVAASAASLIFMAGEERVMPENALLMIHNAWIITAGTAEELRNTADMMDKARDGIVAAYARSGKEDSEIMEMMDETTWMSALDANAMGFATALEQPVQIAASMNAVQVFEKLKDTPSSLLEMLSSNKDDKEPQNTIDPTDPLSASTLVSYALSACEKAGLSNLSESILLSGSFESTEDIDARIEDADKILVMCLAAKLPEKAADFIKAGLNVEQVQARLFDAVVNASDSISIKSLLRASGSDAGTGNSTAHVLNPSAIYAARKQQ